MFEKIKEYYDTGLWSIDRVWNVVGKVLTEAEYEQITGMKYPEKSNQQQVSENTAGDDITYFAP